MAGRAADGVVLAEPASPSYVRWALERAGRPDVFHVAVFSPLCVAADRRTAYEAMAPWLGTLLVDPHAGVRALPFFDDLVALHRRDGVAGLAAMPHDWWTEIGPIGTADDAAAHLDALESAGVHSIGLFPAPELDVARAQIDDVIALARRRSG